jgi:chromosome segregation ATPase
MKLLEVRLTGRNHSEEINFLKGTIMELQEQIEVLTAELNNYKNALSETRRSRTRHQGSGEAEAN